MKGVVFLSTILAVAGLSNCKAQQMGGVASTTLGAYDKSLDLFLIGDFGLGCAGQTQVATAMTQHYETHKNRFDAVLNAGDSFYNTGLVGSWTTKEGTLRKECGSKKVSRLDQWHTMFLEPYKGIALPFFSTIGNHDARVNGANGRYDEAAAMRQTTAAFLELEKHMNGVQIFGGGLSVPYRGSEGGVPKWNLAATRKNKISPTGNEVNHIQTWGEVTLLSQMGAESKAVFFNVNTEALMDDDGILQAHLDELNQLNTKNSRKLIIGMGHRGFSTGGKHDHAEGRSGSLVRSVAGAFADLEPSSRQLARLAKFFESACQVFDMYVYGHDHILYYRLPGALGLNGKECPMLEILSGGGALKEDVEKGKINNATRMGWPELGYATAHVTTYRSLSAGASSSSMSTDDAHRITVSFWGVSSSPFPKSKHLDSLTCTKPIATSTRTRLKCDSAKPVLPPVVIGSHRSP